MVARDCGADHDDVGDSGSCGDANGGDEDDDGGGVSKDGMKQHGSIACRKAVGLAVGVMIRYDLFICLGDYSSHSSH